MTDRFHSLTVVLEENIRSDDAQELIQAIMCLRGVLEVKGNVAASEMMIATSRARMEMRQRLWKALEDD